MNLENFPHCSQGGPLSLNQDASISFGNSNDFHQQVLTGVLNDLLRGLISIKFAGMIH